MNLSYREMALLLSSTVFITSFVVKFIIFDVKLTYMIRDIIMFFAIYMIAKSLFFMIDRILINFRKIM
ncbi:hypothetical protein [Seleniivibrio sp.]|uniref:Uncharacterized protein n=1 Tax=Seleniivibrio woodruffii TaxID=1078050 RepID=A0A4R1KB14_9BACT|nr:hypothetical protein [Seleniivibrio sp.]MCD8553917.1 hypothetical protein [Seleniivibrio sp.]TCK61728.1 hypothetical protein C8D98_0234 [Seleniivibrio woodruffii]TVZ35157.1 hypothetical protein OF66_0759 [Seleniivibrio woodruffii]